MPTRSTTRSKPPGTAESRKAQLTHAYRIMTTRFPGQGPTALGEEKLFKALYWVYRWGWSSAKTINRVGASTNASLAARLVRAKYLEATRTESGLAQKDLPSRILTLTADGLSKIQRELETALPYSTEPAKVRQDQLRHYQMAQTATIESLYAQSIVAYSVEKEMAELSADGVKQPDICWELPSGAKVAVEIELSGKWGRSLDVFVRGCVLALSAAPGKPARFDRILIISDTNAIVTRYRAALSAGSTYEIWKKDANGHIQQLKDLTQKVPVEVAAKITCRKSNV